jgi:hypothetical protein
MRQRKLSSSLGTRCYGTGCDLFTRINSRCDLLLAIGGAEGLDG